LPLTGGAFEAALAASMDAIQLPAVLRDGAALRILPPVDAYLVCNVPLKAAPIIAPTRFIGVAANAASEIHRACLASKMQTRRRRLALRRNAAAMKGKTMFVIPEFENRDDPLHQPRLRVECNYVI